MLNCENIYRVSILDVVFKLNKNYTPWTYVKFLDTFF